MSSVNTDIAVELHEQQTAACSEVCIRMVDGEFRTERVRLFTRRQIEKAMAQQINNHEVVWSRFIWDRSLFEDFMSGKLP